MRDLSGWPDLRSARPTPAPHITAAIGNASSASLALGIAAAFFGLSRGSWMVQFILY